LTKYQSNHF